jgi:hypothetical protein
MVGLLVEKLLIEERWSQLPLQVSVVARLAQKGLRMPRWFAVQLAQLQRLRMTFPVVRFFEEMGDLTSAEKGTQRVDVDITPLACQTSV